MITWWWLLILFPVYPKESLNIKKLIIDICQWITNVIFKMEEKEGEGEWKDVGGLFIRSNPTTLKYK